MNLAWAIRRMLDVAKRSLSKPREALLETLHGECVAIHEEDIAMCRAISENGLSLLKDGDTVLTHCNAGPLACLGYGTGQGPLYYTHDHGKRVRVFADETRPLLQGARLTAFELQEAGVDVTLICDNMSASVMQKGYTLGGKVIRHAMVAVANA